MHWQYAFTLLKEFNRVLKRYAIGAAYGNAKCYAVEDDFISMYNMGGEL